MSLGINGLRIGCYTDAVNRTGCTVLLPPPGAVGGMAIRGGAPGTRETAILGPASASTACHAVLLTGCSLFGLRVADGVVDWCEANGVGLVLPMGTFPIVGAAVVLDIRDAAMQRLDASAGRAACESASEADPTQGAVGVGTGCRIGKEAGFRWSAAGGQGTAVAREGEVAVAALVGVNALGSVYGEDGRLLAGCTAPADAPRFPAADWGRLAGVPADANGGILSNTVIGCVVTNARLDKAAACRVADLAHTGIARAVSPSHTSLDGDALFALSTGECDASLDLVALLAATAVENAIRSAVRAVA